MDTSKMKVVRSFINLCTSKDSFEVTINEIIELSGISKGTFYNNFKSKEDIISYLFNEINLPILKKFKSYIKDKDDFQCVIQFFSNNWIDHIYEYRDEMKSISMIPYIYGFFVLNIEKEYLDIIKNDFPNVSEFQLNIFISYVMSITVTWISSPLPMHPKMFKNQFTSIINSKAIDLIN